MEEYIYLLTESAVIEEEDCSNPPRAFRNLDDAKKAFKENLEEATDNGWIPDKWEISENGDDSFEVYEPGNFSGCHYLQAITKTKLE